MQGTYYETDPVSSVIFMLAVFIVFCVTIHIDKRNTEKKGRNYICQCCENRGGAYRPKNCQNVYCKFYK